MKFASQLRVRFPMLKPVTAARSQDDAAAGAVTATLLQLNRNRSDG